MGLAGIGMTARPTCHDAPSVARAVRVVAVAAAIDVVVAVGATPATDWPTGSGLTL
ncbi:hypothetical protein [Streptomyces yanii]|uniref:Uncharacterized protein n=1 Tax=Streptomyces yanii TaxID=78510 RepID=A0ABV5R4N7_9ACTN